MLGHIIHRKTTNLTQQKTYKKVLEKHPFLPSPFTQDWFHVLCSLEACSCTVDAVVESCIWWQLSLEDSCFGIFVLFFFLFFWGRGPGRWTYFCCTRGSRKYILSWSAALASCLIDKSSENPSSHQCHDISGCSSSSGIVYLLELSVTFGDSGARTASFDIIGHQSLVIRDENGQFRCNRASKSRDSGGERPVST